MILGALWESWCQIVFCEHDEFCSENDIRPNIRDSGSVVGVIFVEYEVPYCFLRA